VVEAINDSLNHDDDDDDDDDDCLLFQLIAFMSSTISNEDSKTDIHFTEKKQTKLSISLLKTVIPLVEQIIISLDGAIRFLLEGISIGSSADRFL
jgi:hypothetical protein